MKTHHVLSIIGLSLISIGLHAQIERLTLRDYALSGHDVRQVTERNYRYDAKQDSVEMGDCIILEFDTSRYLTTFIRANDVFARKQEYRYQYGRDYGQMKCRYRFYEDGAIRQKRTTTQTLHRNPYGHVAVSKTQPALKRDEQGRILEFWALQSSGAVRPYRFHYPGNGTATLRDTEFDDETTYNSAGQMVSHYLVGIRTAYGYHDDGLPAWETKASGSYPRNFRYLYRKDQHGNWVAKWKYALSWVGEWTLMDIWLRQLHYADGISTDTAIDIPEAVRLGLSLIAELPAQSLDPANIF